MTSEQALAAIMRTKEAAEVYDSYRSPDSHLTPEEFGEKAGKEARDGQPDENLLAAARQLAPNYLRKGLELVQQMFPLSLGKWING